MTKEGSKLKDLEARVAALEAPRQEVALTTPDGKFSVKLSLQIMNLANLQLTATAELIDEQGKPVPTSGGSNLAVWSFRQGTLYRSN